VLISGKERENGSIQAYVPNNTQQYIKNGQLILLTE
jgi:hypothetical protein